MPIILTWLVPDQILLSTWSGAITVHDIDLLMGEIQIVFDRADHRLDSVVDLYNAEHIPDEVVPAYLNSPIHTHPRRGRIVVVYPPVAAVRLITQINQIAGWEVLRIARTRAHARDLLLNGDCPPPPGPVV